MSFTFSHPAVVLPLLALPKKWRSGTGLVMGSMAPDFEKFLTMSEHDPHSHTWWGIFYFNLPVALGLAFLFHLVVRNALVQNLPSFLRLRFQKAIAFDWVPYFRKNYGVVVLSILVGTLSHLVLDILTHTPGHHQSLFPFFQYKSITQSISSRMDLKVQIIASTLGVLASLGFVLALPQQRATAPPQRNSRYWPLVICLALAIFGVKALVGSGINHDLYHPIIVFISAGLLSLVLSPLVLNLLQLRKKTTP